MSAYVKKVNFKLHDSYSNPNRTVTKPPYEVTETGWGEFEIVIKIYFQVGEDVSESNLTLIDNPGPCRETGDHLSYLETLPNW